MFLGSGPEMRSGACGARYRSITFQYMMQMQPRLHSRVLQFFRTHTLKRCQQFRRLLPAPRVGLTARSAGGRGPGVPNPTSSLPMLAESWDSDSLTAGRLRSPLFKFRALLRQQENVLSARYVFILLFLLIACSCNNECRLFTNRLATKPFKFHVISWLLGLVEQVFGS